MIYFFTDKFLTLLTSEKLTRIFQIAHPQNAQKIHQPIPINFRNLITTEKEAKMAKDVTISEDKFKCFVRYMIQVAKQKRCVTYYELENLFGLGHNAVGWYAGKLGDYCISRKLPVLNSLIINSTTCEPSNGFEWYLEKQGKQWGEIISHCWREFHITSSREKQSQDFGGRDSDVSEFIAESQIKTP